MPLHMYLHICYFFNTGEITLYAIFCNKLFYLIWHEDLFYIGLAHCFLQQHTILLYTLIDIITFLLVILSSFLFQIVSRSRIREANILFVTYFIWLHVEHFLISLNSLPQNLVLWLYIVQWFSECGLQTVVRSP